MPTLRRSKSGGYAARVRIPADVREEYGRRFGKAHEAKFSAPASTRATDARRLYGEWLAEHEARVATIRAERDGGGATLTHLQAHHLAADWYRWFVARHKDDPGNPIQWDIRSDIIVGELLEFERDPYSGRPSEEAIASVLPRIADDAQTQQFLAQQGRLLSREAQALFLRALFDQYIPALRRLEAHARGDYSTDKHGEALPPPLRADTGETPWQLFEAWVAAREPAQGTVENWRYMLRNLTEHFEGRSAGSLSTDDAREWLMGLISPGRSSRTVYKTWKRAAQTVFQWAVDERGLTANPFAAIKAPRSNKVRKRSDKHLRDDEVRIVLQASLAIVSTESPDDAVKRWVPWLLAYSGARPGEITQMRGKDVTRQDGIDLIRLTPEAGTVKNKEARDVPLHEHIIAQGFLEWVRERGDGPLFYRPRRPQGAERSATKVKKSPAAQARQRLASWIRELGITDTELMPNHAWRHTFKLRGRRAGVSDKYLDDICGHAPPSEGRTYAPTPLEDKATAIARFPRYET